MPHIPGHLPRPFNPGDRRLIGMGAFDPGLAARPIRRPLPPFLSVNDRLSPINTPEANVDLGADPSLRQFHPLFRQKPIRVNFPNKGLLSQNNRLTLFNTPAQDFRSPVDFEDYKPVGVSAINSLRGFLRREGNPLARQLPGPSAAEQLAQQQITAPPVTALPSAIAGSGTARGNGARMFYGSGSGADLQRQQAAAAQAQFDANQRLPAIPRPLAPTTNTGTGNAQAPSGAESSGEPTVAELIARLNPEQTPVNPLARPLDQKIRPTQMPQTGSIAGPQFEIGAGLPAQIDQIDVPETDFDAGQPGFLDKIGGFFKRPGMQDALLAAGAAMMSGRDAEGRAYTDPFQGIGAGLQAGAQAYKADELDRRVEADRQLAEDRRTKVSEAIATLMEGRSPQEVAAIQAVAESGEPGAAAQAVQMAETYADELRLSTAFDELGGRYITDEDEYELVKAMAPAERYQWLLEYRETEKGRLGRAAALMQQMGYTQEQADLIAQDAAVTDRIIAGGTGNEIIKDNTGQSYIINVTTGDMIGGPYGTAFEDLDREQLNLAQAQLDRNLDRDEWTPIYQEAIRGYGDTKDATNDMHGLSEVISVLGAEQLENSLGKPWAEEQAELKKILGQGDPEITAYLQNLLTQMGIQNLSNFKGAISDRELATALSQAGNITETREMLYALMARGLRNRIRTVEKHNDMVRNLAGTGPGQGGIGAAEQLLIADEELEEFRRIERLGNAASGKLARILGEDATYTSPNTDNLIPRQGIS